MTTVTFDTLQFSKKLQARGFKAEQAEGISETLQEVINVAEVATKNDLTKNDLNRLEMKLEAQLSVLKWMIGVSTTGIIALVLNRMLIFPSSPSVIAFVGRRKKSVGRLVWSGR
ncbi:hypothetical protein AGMMS49545_10470 [Betaproteobacteria bacterium]|nr:hypothetical protein AGMMS49545_10470 [Betaproteobacteria bacterium]GHU44383.1 hypothetical protein AGMMS50289_12550 [Betaproteobacteria bacterium]